MPRNLKEKIYLLVEADQSDSPGSRLFDILLAALIVINIIAVTLETVDRLYAQYQWLFVWIEWISITIFTIEYLCRLWVADLHLAFARFRPLQARLRYMVTPYAVIDLLAFLPFFLAFFFPSADLRMLRVFRLVRFLKLARYSPALQTIAHVVRAEHRALLGTLLIMLGLLLLASTLGYYAERNAQPDKFGSIPQAMWWALATLTTVGYGDVTPITAAGRVIGAFVMLFGLGMFALPIAIIATGFSREFHRHEFAVTWAMVANIDLFSDLEPSSIVEFSRQMRSQFIPKGQHLVYQGDFASAMYFLVSGRVRINPGTGKAITRGAGSYFGERALLENTLRKADIVAQTDCRLLILDAHDFHRLMEKHPALHRRLLEESNRRFDRETGWTPH